MSKVLRPLDDYTIARIKSIISAGLTFDVLSMGGGVQSSTLWLMNIAGLITPRAEFAIFSDTGDEREGTHDYLDYLDEQSIKAGFPPIMKVSAGNIVKDALENDGVGAKHAHMPLWVDSGKDKAGRLQRQCTGHYKIKVVRREIRRIFGMNKYAQWIGFSMDEIARRNDTNFPQYITPRYPLLEMRISRDDCKTWLKENGHPEPIKSSCNICPFRSDPEWLDMKKNQPIEFRKATDFCDGVRTNALGRPKKNDPQLTLFPVEKPTYHVYVHKSKEPLNQVKFKDTDETDNHGCGSICAI